MQMFRPKTFFALIILISLRPFANIQANDSSDFPLHHCPLGFDRNASDGGCIDGNYPYIHLTDPNHTVKIEKGYWIGMIDNTTIVADCFFCPFNRKISSNNFIELPKHTDNLTEFFCGPMNRIGNLCEKCQDGYAPAVDSIGYKCIQCSKHDATYSWILFIIGKFLPITVILLTVITLKISVTSGPANSFVLYAQIISTTFGVNAGQILDYRSITPLAENIRISYTSLYGFWNLDFFENVDIYLYCLSPNTTALQLLILDYITASYPLVLLAITAIFLLLYDRGNKVAVCLLKPLHRLLARWNQFLNLKYSILDTFATFLVLSYAKFATTSAYLLYPNRLYTSGGHVFKHVSYFDSSKEYISLEYAIYLTVSLVIIFMCVLMPILLFLYSVRPFNRCLVKFHFYRLVPGDKVQYFLNAFHHCYKDGRNGEHDRRYFSSFYFLTRLILLFSFPFAINWTVQLLIQQIFCTFAIVIISILQPYTQTILNVIDSTMFAILASINALTLYQMSLAMADFPLSATCFYIQLILIYIPLVYIVIVILHSLFYQRCLKRWKVKRRQEHIPSATFSFGEFTDDTSAAGRLDKGQRNSSQRQIKTNLI